MLLICWYNTISDCKDTKLRLYYCIKPLKEENRNKSQFFVPSEAVEAFSGWDNAKKSTFVWKINRDRLRL